jgi:hypothetical protein
MERPVFLAAAPVPLPAPAFKAFIDAEIAKRCAAVQSSGASADPIADHCKLQPTAITHQRRSRHEPVQYENRTFHGVAFRSCFARAG